METIFENALYIVQADKPGNVYRVTNKQTGILEETNQNQYDAIRYAVVYKNALDSLLTKDGMKEGDWPTVN